MVTTQVLKETCRHKGPDGSPKPSENTPDGNAPTADGAATPEGDGVEKPADNTADPKARENPTQYQREDQEGG